MACWKDKKNKYSCTQQPPGSRHVVIAWARRWEAPITHRHDLDGMLTNYNHMASTTGGGCI